MSPPPPGPQCGHPRGRREPGRSAPAPSPTGAGGFGRGGRPLLPPPTPPGVAKDPGGREESGEGTRSTGQGGTRGSPWQPGGSDLPEPPGRGAARSRRRRRGPGAAKPGEAAAERRDGAEGGGGGRRDGTGATGAPAPLPPPPAPTATRTGQAPQGPLRQCACATILPAPPSARGRSCCAPPLSPAAHALGGFAPTRWAGGRGARTGACAVYSGPRVAGAQLG